LTARQVDQSGLDWTRDDLSASLVNWGGMLRSVPCKQDNSFWLHCYQPICLYRLIWLGQYCISTFNFFIYCRPSVQSCCKRVNTLVMLHYH